MSLNKEELLRFKGDPRGVMPKHQVLGKMIDEFTAPIIVNDPTFECITKKRTINGKEYTIKFGLLNRSGEGAACVQIINSEGNIIGRLDIAADGKIYNGMTGNELIDSSDIFHKPGESITVSGYIAGNLTGSNKSIQFTVSTPKRLDKVNSATITGNVIIRHADGGYITNGANITTLGTIVASYKTGNQMSFGITLNEAANFTNNSVLAIVLQNCTITFS